MSWQVSVSSQCGIRMPKYVIDVDGPCYFSFHECPGYLLPLSQSCMIHTSGISRALFGQKSYYRRRVYQFSGSDEKYIILCSIAIPFSAFADLSISYVFIDYQEV